MEQRIPKKKLVLITDEFPYSYREASFLRPELQALKERFSITLISKSASRRQVLPVDPEIRVLHYQRPHAILHLPCFLRLPFQKDFREECRRILKEGGEKRFGNILLSGYFIIEAQMFAAYLKRTGLVSDQSNVDVYYSYWNNYALYALTRLREQGRLASAKVVARTHGYDLYAERQPFSRQPMKQQTDRSLDRLYFISQSGFDYYRAHFSVADFPEKYALARLGTPDRGLAPVPEEAKELSIFSLSNAVPVKRIQLIIEALARITEFPIRWVHYGDGPSLASLRALADAALSSHHNIVYSLPGAIENEALMQLIHDTAFDCLVNVSASEGLPVSVMEALSFGIPVIATDVGGTKELVSSRCGRLLTADPTPQTLADALSALAGLSPESRRQLRENARSVWESRCAAEQNFSAFADSLASLF